MENDFVKITNVAYRILDFFPDSDPLKNRAKEKVLAILENATLIKGAQGWVSLQKEKASAKLLDDIEVLESYLTIARHQGWIDTANFLILVNEYKKIKSQIVAPKGFIKKSLEIVYSVSDVKKDAVYETQEPGINQSEPKEAGTKAGEQGLLQGEGFLTRQEPLSQKALARQKKILQVLSVKGKAQVSDFIKELPNITKRTVRRDLDDLLKRGKLMRIGEWNQVFYQINHVK